MVCVLLGDGLADLLVQELHSEWIGH